MEKTSPTSRLIYFYHFQQTADLIQRKAKAFHSFYSASIGVVDHKADFSKRSSA